MAKLAGYKPEVEIAPSMSVIFCRFLLHLEVLLELENSAWFGVGDLAKFSIGAYGKLAKVAGCKPEVEVAPSMSGIFCRILLHLEVLLELGNRARFIVLDLTKFSIVVYGEICEAGWL